MQKQSDLRVDKIAHVGRQPQTRLASEMGIAKPISRSIYRVRRMLNEVQDFVGIVFVDCSQEL